MVGDQYAKHISILLLFITFIGVCGNMLSLIVFSKSNMRKISIFRFLFYLSISDLLVLLICSTETLLKLGFLIEVRLVSPFTCSFYTFITNLLTHLSSIILMVISVERASVICDKKIWSIFKRNTAKNTNVESKEKISLKELESAEITTATATTTTTLNSNTSLANFNFNLRERFQSLKKYSLFKCFFNNHNNNNNVISCISKIDRIESIMIIIVIALIILNSHYLFFMKLNQSTQVEKKINDWANTTKPCKFCYLNNYVNKSKNNYNNNILNNNIKLTNLTRFFNIKPQEKIKEQLKNQINHKKTQTKRNLVCYPMNGTNYNYFLNHIWIWIDIWVYSLIPFVVMSTCSIIILVEINRKSKRYLSYLEKETSKSNRIKADKRLRRNKQLLFMLTSTNLFFILFSLLPYCISFFKFKGRLFIIIFDFRLNLDLINFSKI
jgi:hypothetical protein